MTLPVLPETPPKVEKGEDKHPGCPVFPACGVSVLPPNDLTSMETPESEVYSAETDPKEQGSAGEWWAGDLRADRETAGTSNISKYVLSRTHIQVP